MVGVAGPAGLVPVTVSPGADCEVLCLRSIFPKRRVTLPAADVRVCADPGLVLGSPPGMPGSIVVVVKRDTACFFWFPQTLAKQAASRGHGPRSAAFAFHVMCGQLFFVVGRART